MKRNSNTELFLAEVHYAITLLEAEYGKVSPEDYGQLDYVYRTKEEVQTMLAASLEQERKKIYQKGEAAGVVKGETQGRMKNQQEMIAQLLRFRFELAEAELHTYGQQVAKIQQLQHLDELVNTLLNKTATFEDFTKLLTQYLPADQVA